MTRTPKKPDRRDGTDRRASKRRVGDKLAAKLASNARDRAGKQVTAKQVTLRARWEGEQPTIGSYLMSQTRPRNAYRIASVRERKDCLELTCDVVKPVDVPEGALVHPWRWDPRTKAGVAWSAT